MASLFPVDATLGAAFVGFAFSCAVFGVITSQIFSYFQRYPGDKILYKFMVRSGVMDILQIIIQLAGRSHLVLRATCFVSAKPIIFTSRTLELIDQFFIGDAIYFYTIIHYNQPLVLLTEPVAWTLILQLTIGAIIGTIKLCDPSVALNRKILVTAIVVFLTISDRSCHRFQTPYFILLPNYNVKTIPYYSMAGLIYPSHQLLASFSLGAGALADIVTASALCFFLRRFRTGNKRSDTLVNTLIIYAINTGAFTAAIGILTLIFYDLSPRTFRFMALYFILGKLYAISFLCTLNTRQTKTDRGNRPSSLQAPSTDPLLPQHELSPLRQAAVSISKALDIGIHRETSARTDIEAEEKGTDPEKGPSGISLPISANHVHVDCAPSTEPSGYRREFSPLRRAAVPIQKNPNIDIHPELSASTDIEAQVSRWSHTP
ncbi:hypothetical protein K438DRAFT_1969353 [Mycena galopus ATCC 62051]|nr:hypothetical protein K438DRAFT_1969353 [Mycena galopus ATCC 62051]